jgi:HD-like signal output (HDOD) protein
MRATNLLLEEIGSTVNIKDIEVKLARAPLPAFPNVVAQIMRLSEDPGATAKDYEKIINISPELSAKILRTANSSFYGGNSQVATIQAALMRLGSETIRSICVAVTYQASLPSKAAAQHLNLEAYWQHSLGVACATKILATLHKSPLKEPAFIAGLLHDIGKQALYMLMPQEAALVRYYQEQHVVDDYEAEMATLGVTHEEIGELAAHLWGLPDILLDPIAHHHQPLPFDNIKPLTAYVNVGNALAYEAGLICSPPGPHNEADPTALAFLDLPQEQYTPLRSVILKEVQMIGCQLSVSR